jgi:hypothetical protein
LYVPVRVPIIPDSFTRALRQYPTKTSGSEAGETRREIAVNFAYEVSVSYL